MRTFLLLLALIAAAALASAARAKQEWPMRGGPVMACPKPEDRSSCREVRLDSLRLKTPQTLLVRSIDVEPNGLPLPRPAMVWMIGMSSSEIRWNGVPIGRNGRPAATRAGEKPGLFIATFIVPERLVRPGRNEVTALISAHHLWLPVRRPIHVFGVGPYHSSDLPGLYSYLPALLALGALAAAFIYFGAAFALDRRDRSALLLAAIAGAALLQLAVEIARSFILYTYPWHLARVGAIALLAAGTAVLIAAYSARRFWPERSRTIVGTTASLSLASLLLVPWYDLKALAALLAAAGAMIACGIRGARRSAPDARAAAAAGLAMIALMAWQLTAFLDQSYYLLLAVLLVALVAEQILALRQARRGLGDARSRASLLEERLRQAQGRDRFVALKDGSRVHRIAEAEIVFVRAADDYCEARLADGRDMLVTANLAALHTSLPEQFVRVHKSYVVNADHVAAMTPRPGGGRALSMSDGSGVPVGRAYRGKVEEALKAR